MADGKLRMTVDLEHSLPTLEFLRGLGRHERTAFVRVALIAAHRRVSRLDERSLWPGAILGEGGGAPEGRPRPVGGGDAPPAPASDRPRPAPAPAASGGMPGDVAQVLSRFVQ